MKNQGKFVFVLIIIFTFISIANTSAEYILLPAEGAVGVGKKIKMILHEKIFGDSDLTINNADATWSSSNPKIASIDQDGIVTGIKEGIVKITAKRKGFIKGDNNETYESHILVAKPVASLRFIGGYKPNNLTIQQFCSDKIKVEALDKKGTVLNARAILWKISNPNIITDQTKVNVIRFDYNEYYFHKKYSFMALQAGQVILTAICEGVSNQITVTVTNSDPYSLEIAPENILIDVQEIKQAKAKVKNKSGCVIPSAVVTWSIENSSIATVDSSTGVVCGVKSGTTKLTGTTQNGITKSIAVTVPAVDHIRIDQPTATIDLNGTATFTITAISASGRSLNNRIINWSINNNNVTIQSHSGYTATVVGIHSGSTTLTATCEEINPVPAVTALITVLSCQCSRNASSYMVKNNMNCQG